MRKASSTALLGVVAALAIGCRGGSNVTPPLVTSAKAAESKRAEAPHAAPRLTVRVLLDDPRLASVRELERAKDFAGAARVIHDARPADLPTSEACAWDHLEGRMLAAANAPEAAAAFDRASAPACPIAPWSKLRAAQALGRAGNAEEALTRVRAIPEDVTAARDETKLMLAEALGAKNDRVAALPIWRTWLAANPHGSRWVDTAVRIANAWLDGIDGAPETHAREAYDLATRVVVEAPKVAEAVGAPAARARAVALLRGKDGAVSDALSELERAKQAQGWLDANEPSRAWDLASQVLTAAGGKPGPAACKAAMVRATAFAKVKKTGEPWSDAVAACEKDDQLAQALFSGGKARAPKDPRLAMTWFGRLEQAFPTHRLADDARLKGALLLLGSGEENADARAEEMLRTLPDVYPAGDMRTESLFRAALERMKRGDWEGARPSLERVLALAPDDRHWASAGRASYFLARADQKAGNKDAARARFVEIVQKHPLAFYMLLSHARLAEMDAPFAKKTLEEAMRRDVDDGAPAARPTPAVLASPAIARAVRLLEVSEVDAAKREISASGALADGADPDVLPEIGALYNQAGLFDLGHAFSRRTHEMFTHYPEGRWRLAWEAAYPRAFQPLVTKACETRGLPTPVAWAIMREESSFFAEAKSPSNAYGLMQLIMSTAQLVAKDTGFAVDETQLKRPEVSIELGVKLLASLRARHKHPALAIGAYNGGSGAVDRWVSARGNEELDLFVELVPYEETRNYVKRVLSTQAAYAWLYEPNHLAEPLGLPLGFRR